MYHLRELAGICVADNRDHPVATQSYHCVGQGVVTRNDEETLGTARDDESGLFHVARCFLYAYYLAGILPCKPYGGVDAHVDPAASGDVIENHRDWRCLGYLTEMAVHPLLCGFVVIRHNREDCGKLVEARHRCNLAYQVARAVSTHSQYNGDTSRHAVKYMQCQLTFLIGRQGRGLGSCAECDDIVCAPVDKIVDVGVECRIVY